MVPYLPSVLEATKTSGVGMKRSSFLLLPLPPVVGGSVLSWFSRMSCKCFSASSSFSIPDGIAGTDRLMAFRSASSGSSSALKTCMGLDASKVLARKFSLEAMVKGWLVLGW